MPKWSPKRAARLERRGDGTFKVWKGGRTLASLPDKEQNYQGIATHIGERFRAQNGGRVAKVGDIHRTKNRDGTYSGQASWYVRTRYGWRKSPTRTTKPTAKQITAALASARPGKRDTTRRK